MLPPVPPTYALLIPLFFGGIALLRYWFSAAAKLRRAIGDVRVTSIRDARAGELVRITGKIRPIGEPLRSPITGRSCVAFRSTLEESGGVKGTQWREVLREIEAVDFFLEDTTGRALIRTDAFEMLITDDTERCSGLLDDPTPDLQNFLARHRESYDGWLFNRTLRYKEGTFDAGEIVTVLGIARWEADPDPDQTGTGYRDRPKRLVIEARPDGPVLATDEPPLATAPRPSPPQLHS